MFKLICILIMCIFILNADNTNMHNKDHTNIEKINLLLELYSQHKQEKSEKNIYHKFQIEEFNNTKSKEYKKELFHKSNNIHNKKSTPNIKSLYPFTLYNSDFNYFSIEQANQIVSNSTIFLNDWANDTLLKYTDNSFAKLLLNIALAITFEETLNVWSHEEGHRSILTYHNISSTNKWENGEVINVATKTLNAFKKDNYIDFMRLHTAGIESQAVLIDDYEERYMFEKQHHEVSVNLPIWINKLTNYFYISSNDRGNGIDDESKNSEFSTAEMDRDIVGHDVYGFIRHIFNRNDINYQNRYTIIDNFTLQEKIYHNKLRKRAWITFLDMNLFRNFFEWEINSFKTSLGFNHYLSPFGDVTDFNVLINSQDVKNKLTIRQMRNHNNEFYGVQFKDYRRNFGSIWLTSTLNIWQNPKNFDFFTSEIFYGGSLSLNIEYKLTDKLNISTKLLSKTKGFLPGVNDNNLKSLSAITAGIILKY